MRITITFDGIPEMLRTIDRKKALEMLHAADVYEDLPGNNPGPDEFVRVPVDKVTPEAEEKPAPAKAEKPAPADTANTANVDESYRVKVRGVLAALNKKTGENTATKLIKGFGVAKLTDVALKDLPALMKQAEEALNA